MTSKKRIIARVQEARDALDPLKRKIHAFRRTVAGDYSAIDRYYNPQTDETADDDKGNRIEGLYSILVRSFESGQTNYILQALRTVVQQVAFRFPSIDFEDAEPDAATINSLYLAKRMGPPPQGCNTIHHQRKTLLDMLIGGIGWSFLTHSEAGVPKTAFIDSLDCVWDIQTTNFLDMRWAAVDFTLPLGEWLELLPDSDVLKKIEQDWSADKVEGDDTYLDMTLVGTYYFDAEGDDGTAAVFFPEHSEDGEMEDAFGFHEANYYRMDMSGEEVPFVPLEPCYFMELPSVRMPIGLVEMIFPSQMALRKSSKKITSQSEQLRGYIDIAEDAYDQETVKKLKNGEELTLLFRKDTSKPPAQVIQPIEISQGQIWNHEYHEKRLTAMSGINPYAAGDKVEGVNYAAEVNAIESSAGLNAGAISSDHAQHWQRVISKFLAFGARWDVSPLKVVYDGVPLEFGPENPVGFYLSPDVPPTVSENSMAYESLDKRIGRAMQDVDMALKVALIAPNAPALAYENYLRAKGEKNIKPYFEMPQSMTETNPADAGEEAAGQETQE